jgi:hypothetical protein
LYFVENQNQIPFITESPQTLQKGPRTGIDTTLTLDGFYDDSTHLVIQNLLYTLQVIEVGIVYSCRERI